MSFIYTLCFGFGLIANRLILGVFCGSVVYAWVIAGVLEIAGFQWCFVVGFSMCPHGQHNWGVNYVEHSTFYYVRSAFRVPFALL